MCLHRHLISMWCWWSLIDKTFTYMMLRPFKCESGHCSQTVMPVVVTHRCTSCLPAVRLAVSHRQNQDFSRLKHMDLNRRHVCFADICARHVCSMDICSRRQPVHVQLRDGMSPAPFWQCITYVRIFKSDCVAVLASWCPNRVMLIRCSSWDGRIKYMCHL